MQAQCYDNTNSMAGTTKSSATAETVCIRGHFAVQGHSRSLILIPTENLYATS